MERGNVAIAIPCDPELARSILNRGRRLARSLGLGWVALRVDRRDSRTPIENAHELLEIVTSSGGRLVCAGARDIARRLVELSSREHARVLVIGRSRRPWFLRRLKRRTTERILREPRSFDVVIAAERDDR